ncbi:ASCH domain-containing protein [Brevibacterium zhoupengii]|uniref:ASCH domain-containing protein n=1 Tax=Brevibacterium zhoupengii TaxID=2898795 RepID=UPI001E3AB8AD|nr:ASCH domain-containing protein [Brevibacterium zhoupengii]
MEKGVGIEDFWLQARTAVPMLPSEVPEAWAFGATSEHADELLALVIAGTKTGTASSMLDVEAEGDSVPEPGDLSIILDGSGHPRAVIETTAVECVPFSAVSAEHAFSEGEGDRTLAHWRSSHEAFWREYGQGAGVFSEDMLIVCERFELMFAA